MLPLSKADLVITATKYPTFQEQRTPRVKNMLLFLERTNWLVGCKLTTWIFPSWKSQRFIVIEIDMDFEYKFSLSACTSSTSTTIQGLLKQLIHIQGIPHNISSDEETLVYSKLDTELGPMTVQLINFSHYN